ncbi:SMC-Scp complex subunit ScpB [Teredinibacter turnerae]|uniref:SMC-Scp complex subunit ScpB n=1 Tax=Teredinibacter turnerae TaxID=2426 RepID=UPI0003F9C2F3|nr:SMC-Scp complex subunit ScpB [Teredinibacter turnerae]
MSHEIDQLKFIVEGAVLAAGEPVTLDRLLTLFDENETPTKDALREAIAAIQTDCEGRGFQLIEVASGYRFQVKEDLAVWINRLWEEKPQKYSRALLETLALIAYRQPITRGDIEEVRGVAVSSHIIKTLAERDWVKVVGHRDVPGRPALYATTRQFLDYFNLKSLDELPTLGELRDIDSLNETLEFDSLPPEVQESVMAAANAAEHAEGTVPEGESADGTETADDTESTEGDNDTESTESDNDTDGAGKDASGEERVSDIDLGEPTTDTENMPSADEDDAQHIEPSAHEDSAPNALDNDAARRIGDEGEDDSSLAGDFDEHADIANVPFASEDDAEQEYELGGLFPEDGGSLDSEDRDKVEDAFDDEGNASDVDDLTLDDIAESDDSDDAKEDADGRNTRNLTLSSTQYDSLFDSVNAAPEDENTESEMTNTADEAANQSRNNRPDE